MERQLVVCFFLSLSLFGSIATQAPPPAQVKAKDLTLTPAQVHSKDQPLVQGATRGPSGLWETEVNVGACNFEMVQVPAGSFHSPRYAADVTITRPFLMQKTHVTVEQFRAFVDATGYRTEAEQGDGAHIRTTMYVKSVPDANWRNPCFAQEERCPVVCVSWNDAQAFIAWLNGEVREVAFRLPTEAEWEYACRAGSASVAYGPMDAIAWYGTNSGDRTHPVAQKRPNAFGLFDMLGNAWQWCQDWFDYFAGDSSQDPQGPSYGGTRVERGGSWLDSDLRVRAGGRDQDPQDDRWNTVGFRVVAAARAQ